MTCYNPHMSEDKPHLQIVGPDFDHTHDEEFAPLPFYPWDERPITVPLDDDEVATALHLAKGDVPAAAVLLKVGSHLVDRRLRRSPTLQRILSEAQSLVLHRAAAEYIRALDSDNDRRREWGAKNLLASRLAQGHPFSPAPPLTQQTNANLTVNTGSRTVTFRWRTDEDDAPIIDNDGAAG